MHHWHTLTPKEALDALESNPHGLSQEEIQARLKLYGKNILAAAASISMTRRFLRQFNNPLIYVLLAAALVTGLMQHFTDTMVILCVVLVNALIGFFQESKAETALAAIRAMLSPSANVIRANAAQTIVAEELVPGDLVVLTAGDKVPADLRLLSAHALRAQEAILTGESFDVEKSSHCVAEDMSLGDRASMAYSGTLITAGQGKGVVVATGKNTEIGRIGSLLTGVESPATPLTLKLTRFSKWLAAFIVVIAFAIFMFGTLVRHLSMSEMFMVMIGIAVSAIPEGLPAVISITLALGVRAMAKRNAIVRHLPVIEALGSINVICTDKTGTLTRNELSVCDIITAERSFSVTGAGYAPQGEILFERKEIGLSEYPTVSDIGHAAMLNNDAVLTLHKGVWELNGDPTEGALMTFALKAGHEEESVRKHWPRTDVIPFSAEARYMATLHHNAVGSGLIYVKGAPEQILAMCSTQQDAGGDDNSLDLAYWQSQIDKLARQGKRVLAVARRHTSATHKQLHPKDIEKDLSLLGLFGIMDAPREEAKASIAACLNAGITVKMITGDHVLTASAIGKMLGIPDADKVMTGLDIERLSDSALSDAVKEVNIYARMHPEHKLRLVEALQASGAVVAMTGDGVNDAPALKKADIGIAMGKQGTEVAREASDLVLVDDNFASITYAIEEGRNIYRNIRRTIQFMLVTDGAEGLTLILATLAGLTLPITPLQILWVNMVTAVTLSLAFAFAPSNPAVMRAQPLSVQMPFFSRASVISFLFHTALIALGTIGLFLYQIHQTGNVIESRTIAVNVLVWFQIYYLWSLFPSRRGALPLIIATLSVVLFQLGFTYFTWMQSVFATTSLDLAAWLKIMAVGASISLWLWLERLFSLRLYRL